MKPAPLRRFPRSFGDGKLLPGVRGGNLARVISNALSSQTGHFLFMSEQFQKLLRQITDTGRVAMFPGSASAPAAPPHGSVSRRVPQALSFVLPEVNHVAHFPVSRCETLFNRSAFA